MKATSLIIITSIFFLGAHSQATFLPTEKVPQLTKQNVTDIVLEDFGTDTVKVVAVTKHSNNCLIPNSKVKTKEILNGTISYQLFGYDNNDRLCPTVINPRYKNIVLDIILKTDIDMISDLEVNGLAISI